MLLEKHFFSVFMQSIKKYRVTLKGRILDKAFEHSLLLDLNTTASELAPIHRLAAKAWVKELTDEEGNVIDS